MSTYPGYRTAALSPSFRSSLSAGLSPNARTMSGSDCAPQPESPHAEPDRLQRNLQCGDHSAILKCVSINC